MAELVPELTQKEFEDLTKSSGLVLIDFFADWCMPCMMMIPVVDDLALEFSGQIKFGKVNVGDYQDLAAKFNVSSIPNFTLLKDGKILEQFVGSISMDDFEEKLKKHI
jgi:thioredoxin 1